MLTTVAAAFVFRVWKRLSNGQLIVDGRVARARASRALLVLLLVESGLIAVRRHILGCIRVPWLDDDRRAPVLVVNERAVLTCNDTPVDETKRMGSARAVP